MPHYFLPGYKSKVVFLLFDTVAGRRASSMRKVAMECIRFVRKKWQHVCGHLGEQMLKTVEM